MLQVGTDRIHTLREEWPISSDKVIYEGGLIKTVLDIASKFLSPVVISADQL